MATLKWLVAISCCLVVAALVYVFRAGADGEAALVGEPAAIRLPEPRRSSEVSVEQSLLSRRSVRTYKDAPLAMSEIGQLLWAAQGITGSGRFRTAPSAGALYPLETYVVAGRVDGLAPGVYKYSPGRHELIPVTAGDLRNELADAGLGQESIEDGAIDIVFAVIYRRTTKKYGDRGVRYVHMEAGHAAQNVCLQATAMGLGTVTIGAFRDDAVKRILKMPDEEAPLYILPVGKK